MCHMQQFFTVFPNEKDINGAFMLCYVESKFCTVTVIAFPQYFSKTSHVFRFRWLLVHCIMMLTGCMICKTCNCSFVCLQQHPISTSCNGTSIQILFSSVRSFLLHSVYEMSRVYSASQRFASLGSEIIVDPTACYY